MKLQTKKIIDHLVGSALLAFVDLAALALGFILRRSHAAEPVHTILVMKFQGMGSLVLAKPALHALRRRYPKARIIFLGTPGTAPLARVMPEFDEVIILQDRGLFPAALSLLRILPLLWRRRVDWAFDLEVYSKLSSVIATLSCARNRAGFALESVRLRRYAHTHLMLFNRYEHLGTAYHRLLAIPSGEEPAGSEAGLDYGSWAFSPARPRLIPGTGPYVVLNPHAGDLCHERMWPLKNFEALAGRLLDENPELHVVFIGYGKAEMAVNAKIAPRPRLLDIAGKMTLEETIGCLAHAAAVVTNDSGPMHLALASGPAVIGLFGPTRPQAYFLSSHPASQAFYESLYCSPCVHHWDPPPCGGDNQCMKRITVAQVAAAATKALAAPLGPKIVPQKEPRPPAAPGSFFAGLIHERGSHGPQDQSLAHRDRHTKQ